jgi:hypothetical protein
MTFHQNKLTAVHLLESTIGIVELEVLENEYHEIPIGEPKEVNKKM